MNCEKHEMRNGINTCGKCGQWLCEECSVEVDGRIICKNCVSELISGKKPHRHVHHEHRHEHIHCAERRERKPYINKLFLFFFSWIPGINYMYMGLMKRGVLALAAFCLSGYAAGTLEQPLFGILAGIIYVVSFFDGFKVRRQLLEGAHVEDGFSDIMACLSNNKIGLAILGALIVCSSFVSRTLNTISWRYRDLRPIINIARDFSSLIVMALIIYGVYYFFIKPKKKSSHIDKRFDDNDNF